MKKFVIIGGGTAGWLSALWMIKAYPNDSITLIESKEIGTIGFGEGTTPNFKGFLKEVGIDEKEFHESVSSTIKVGIDFKHWAKDKSSYLHDFNIDNPDKPLNTAYHFNNYELKEFFRKKCIGKLNHVIGNVIGFERNGEDISKIKTDVGIFDSDFILDCSGIQRLVIGREYNQKWISLSDQLRVNSVISFSIDNETPIEKFTHQKTTATALKNGWLWQIPLNDVTNFGYVFDGNLITQEEAKQEIRELYGNDIEFKRYFTFDSGYYEKMWVGNSVCIGLSSGFFEPIEATSIMISIIQLGKLLLNDFSNKDKYNNFMKNVYESTFSFIRYHYVCDRTDTEFWKIYNSLPLPEKLSKLLTKNLRMRNMTDEEFYSILPDSTFTLSSFGLLSQYNFENKKEKTLV